MPEGNSATGRRLWNRGQGDEGKGERAKGENADREDGTEGAGRLRSNDSSMNTPRFLGLPSVPMGKQAPLIPFLELELTRTDAKRSYEYLKKGIH